MSSPAIEEVPAVIPISRQDPPSLTVAIEKIFPNRRQPRENFNEENIRELAESIAKEGILQPLVVAPSIDGRYELIAGERRWRAAKAAGLKEVPVVLRRVEADKMLELALIENIQRQDLNSIEEAKGYQSLCDQFHFNPADIAQRVGKSREHVANTLRLLKLPRMIQEDVAQNRLSAGHARALLALDNPQEQIFWRNRIVESGLNVRAIEKMIQERMTRTKKNRLRSKMFLSPQTKLLIEEIEKTLATKVHWLPGKKEGEGRLAIECYSWQELDRIYRKLIA